MYLNQAICLSFNRYYPGITLTPSYKQKPCIISDHIHYTDENVLECIPGLDLFAVFVNLELTYEDGMVLSRSAAARLKYNASVSVYLSPYSDTIPVLGYIIEPFSKSTICYCNVHHII